MDTAFARFQSARLSVWDILQELVYEGRRKPFANLKDLQMLLETNGTISMTRQSEKLYCSGKGV